MALKTESVARNRSRIPVIANFQRFVLPRRSARRAPVRSPPDSVFENDLGFDRWVAPRIENLKCADGLDVHAQSNSSKRPAAASRSSIHWPARPVSLSRIVSAAEIANQLPLLFIRSEYSTGDFPVDSAPASAWAKACTAGFETAADALLTFERLRGRHPRPQAPGPTKSPAFVVEVKRFQQQVIEQKGNIERWDRRYQATSQSSTTSRSPWKSRFFGL